MVATEFLTLEEKRELILRMADSDLFRRAPRQREFLLYVAACTLDNHLEGVREQAIAEKVFQRSPEQYDLGDTIVRAEARNLRKRLEKYFEAEGSAEPFTVVMPKGGYALAFRLRATEVSPPEPEAVTTSLADSLPATPPAIIPAPPQRRVPLLPVARTTAIAAFCIFAAVVSLWFYSVRTKASSANVPATNGLPFSGLFSRSRDTLIVTSDTAFWQIAQLSNRKLTLDDYLTRTYPEIPHLWPRDLVQDLNRFQYTDADETTIAAAIMRANAGSIQRTYLRSGHQLDLADFKAANIILLGSPISNPWAELYSNHLNFQFDRSLGVGIILRNRSAHGNEPAAYPGRDDARFNRTYAHLVFIPPSSEHAGSVLLIAGTTAEATQAAGEFLLNESKLSSTLKSIGIDPARSGQYFELLLRATTFVGGATESEVVASRRRPYSASNN